MRYVTIGSLSKAITRSVFALVNLSTKFYLSHRPDGSPAFNSAVDPNLYQGWIQGMEENNLGDLARFYFLRLNLTRCLHENIAGALAEVGVYRGNSAKILHAIAPHRRFYLFDTFSGFSQEDFNASEASLFRKHFLGAPKFRNWFRGASVAEVKAFIEGSDELLKFCEGRFPKTTSLVPEDERFAFVHLDCDLELPTFEALTFFYPRMSSGGVIVVHDYVSKVWRGVQTAVDKFMQDKPETIVLIPDKSGSIVIPINKRK